MTDRANSPANHAARAFGLAANQFEGAEASRLLYQPSIRLPQTSQSASSVSKGVVVIVFR